MVDVLVVKLKEKGSRNPGCIKYKNTVYFKNPTNLAILFSDLELYGANIPRAFEKYKAEKMKENDFPW